MLTESFINQHGNSGIGWYEKIKTKNNSTPSFQNTHRKKFGSIIFDLYLIFGFGDDTRTFNCAKIRYKKKKMVERN